MDRIDELEARIKILEENDERFMDGLEKAAEHCMSVPMIRVMIPEQMRNSLQSYLDMRKAQKNGSQKQIVATTTAA